MPQKKTKRYLKAAGKKLAQWKSQRREALKRVGENADNVIPEPKQTEYELEFNPHLQYSHETAGKSYSILKQDKSLAQGGPQWEGPEKPPPIPALLSVEPGSSKCADVPSPVLRLAAPSSRKCRKELGSAVGAHLRTTLNQKSVTPGPATWCAPQSWGRPPRDCREELTGPHKLENATSPHHHVKCYECGRDVVGFRYKCVQCADCDLCAACEARGAHPDHYVLRIPRPLQLVQIQILAERVQGCLEAEALVERRQVKVENEEHIYSEIKIEEEQLIRVKPEPMETADVTESSSEPPVHQLKPEPEQPPTPRSPPAPAPRTYPTSAPTTLAPAPTTDTAITFKPCPDWLTLPLPTVYSWRAPGVALPNPTLIPTSTPKKSMESGAGIFTELGSHRQRQP